MTLTNSPGYCPETDISEALKPKEARYCQSLIGKLHWFAELGQAGITNKVSMLASFMAFMQTGQINQILNIFAFLKCHHNTKMIFDLSFPKINEADFERES